MHDGYMQAAAGRSSSHLPQARNFAILIWKSLEDLVNTAAAWA